MSVDTARKAGLQVELRAVEGTTSRVFVLLPSLEELLGVADFGHRNPIFLPRHVRPLDGWAIFGSVRERGVVLH